MRCPIRWRSAASAWSVMPTNSRRIASDMLLPSLCLCPLSLQEKVRVRALTTQGLTVDFAGRRPGQLRHKLDLPGVFMLTELRLHEGLEVRSRVRSGRLGDDVGLDDLAAQGVRYPDHGCFHNRRMLQQCLLDLQGAHGPAGRNDDVVRAAFVVEI